MATREQLAAQYDTILAQYDAKAREVSVLDAEFDQTNEDRQKIKEIKIQMEGLMRKAENLVGGNS